jgi:membrane protein
MIHKKIYHHVRTHKHVNRFVEFTKKITLPGLENARLYTIIKLFHQGFEQGAINTRVSAVAFHFFLAIFPTVIFLFTLIPYIPIENFQDELMNVLKDLLPHSAFQATQSTLEDIIKNQDGGLLSIGFIGAVYFSTNGFHTMIDAFNKCYHSIETRSGFMQRMISLLLMFIFTILIVTAIALIVVTEIMLSRIDFNDESSAIIIVAGRFVIIFALIFCTISFMYYLGPAKKARWGFLSIGSFLATVFILATSYGFAFYVNNFGQYNKIYGSIGTLIVILLWIYFNSYIIILGFELNACVQFAKKNKLHQFTPTSVLK